MRFKNFRLMPDEVEALEHLAEVSGMDSWFYVDCSGKIRDRGSHNMVVGQKPAIKDLVENASVADIEKLGAHHSLVVMCLLSRLVASQKHTYERHQAS